MEKAETESGNGNRNGQRNRKNGNGSGKRKIGNEMEALARDLVYNNARASYSIVVSIHWT